jgi:hypothetical protein
MTFMQVSGMAIVVPVLLTCMPQQNQNTNYNFQNTHIQIDVWVDTKAYCLTYLTE